MDKRAVIQDLHALMDTRLFSGRPWLADYEACNALDRKLHEMGLAERVPGDKASSRNTALGHDSELDIIMVFIGLWEEFHIPYVLEQYGLIDEIDEMRLYDRLATSDDPEKVLAPTVRRAYRDRYQQSRFLA
jgi:hypothetical protein